MIKPGLVQKIEKKQRKKERKKKQYCNINKDVKVSLMASDKGSYYQNWSDDSGTKPSETIRSSRKKIESRQEKGSVEI